MDPLVGEEEQDGRQTEVRLQADFGPVGQAVGGDEDQQPGPPDVEAVPGHGHHGQSNGGQVDGQAGQRSLAGHHPPGLEDEIVDEVGQDQPVEHDRRLVEQGFQPVGVEQANVSPLDVDAAHTWKLLSAWARGGKPASLTERIGSSMGQRMPISGSFQAMPRSSSRAYSSVT